MRSFILMNPVCAIIYIYASYLITAPKRKREAAVYRYEIARLTVFLEHEDILPRTIKETFTLIDVKEESKKIREEIKRKRDAAAIADSDETMPPPKDKPNGDKPSGDNKPDDDDDGDDGVLV